MIEFLKTLVAPGTITGAIHVSLAVICLILGPIIFRRRKGDNRHRLLGRIWAGMMLVVNISALLTYDISGRPNMFHAFALLNLIALVPGVLFIWRYKRTRNREHLLMHRKMMAWAYFGLAAAGVWQVATNFIRMGMVDVNIGIMFNGLGVLTFIAAGCVYFYLERRRPKTL